MKNVLVINTSLRANSNSDALGEEFAKGAKESGNNVETLSLKGKKMAFCVGCLACQKLKKCVIADDAVEITEKMRKADVIAFSTPIYYYEMSGQMKTLIDRANSLFSSDYAFRDIYLLSAAADDEEGTDEGAYHGLTGWTDCFEKAEIKGRVFAGGVNDGGEIADHPALKQAYKFGKSIK